MLGQDEPFPAIVVNEEGQSPIVLVCEHAGNRVPRSLDSLGLDGDRLQEHIAWDIGAEAVARSLSDLLDTALVLQPYSRLVIDCNRPPASEVATPVVSDGVMVPGNFGLTAEQRARRADAIFHPFHNEVTSLLDKRRMQGRRSILITVHSFTATYGSFRRPWHFGAQYNRDPALSRTINRIMARDMSLCVGDNQPYPVNDETHYTIPEHGERRGIGHAMLEIRNDLIDALPGQTEWSQRLASAIIEACDDAGVCDDRKGVPAE